MRYSASNALMRVCGVGPLPDLLEERAGERGLLDVYEKVGVPIATRDSLNTPVPLYAPVRLFERSARLLGDRTFGFDVGAHMSHMDYGLWGEHCGGAATLGEALRRVATTSWAQQIGADLEVVPVDREHYVFRYVPPDMDEVRIQQSDHLLVPMLSLVRLYLGHAWQPDWYEVNYARDPDAHRLEDKLKVPIRFAKPGVGLALTKADLLRKRVVRREERRIVTLRDVAADVTLTNAPALPRAISATVALRLMDGQSDADGAARLLGLSVQGLQRRLKQEGYTYREILEQARSARATRLLLETDLPVVEIGLSVGYNDHPNFTRAFTKWMGCTPFEFRRARIAKDD